MGRVWGLNTPLTRAMSALRCGPTCLTHQRVSLSERTHPLHRSRGGAFALATLAAAQAAQAQTEPQGDTWKLNLGAGVTGINASMSWPMRARSSTRW